MPTIIIPVLVGPASQYAFAAFAVLIVVSVVIWMVRAIAAFISSWLPTG